MNLLTTHIFFMGLTETLLAVVRTFLAVLPCYALLTCDVKIKIAICDRNISTMNFSHFL